MSTLTEKSISVAAATVTCCAKGCGLVFAVPSWWEQERRRLHDDFWCPNGHRQHFPGETREERRIRELQEEVENQKRAAEEWREDYTLERDARQQVQRSLSATKGVLTRTKNRVAKGVCPCCNRTFQNLQRHMHTKHPDFAADGGHTIPEG